MFGQRYAAVPLLSHAPGLDEHMIRLRSHVAFRVCRHFERSEEHLVGPGGGAGVALEIALEVALSSQTIWQWWRRHLRLSQIRDRATAVNVRFVTDTRLATGIRIEF